MNAVIILLHISLHLIQRVYVKMSIVLSTYTVKMPVKSIRDSCIELLESEETRKNLREIIQPISNMIYNEAYPYIWFICIYIVAVTFIILANLLLLLRLLSQLGGLYVTTTLEYT